MLGYPPYPQRVFVNKLIQSLSSFGVSVSDVDA
jgi:hypothetical protein